MIQTRSITIIFINGPVPSAEDRALFDKLISSKSKVVYRNALQVQPEEKPEKCNFVAATSVSIPAPYAGIPHAEEGKVLSVPATDENSTAEEKANAERITNDKWAQEDAKLADLKSALDDLKIPYAPNAKKAELIQLYLNRP